MINLSFPSGDSLDRIEHKRQVLAAHCATVGRDPADIAVSYKAVVSIAQTTDLARTNWESWRTGRGIPAVDSSAGVFVGTPRDIAKQFEGWRRLGIDHFVIELTNTEPASVALATEALGEAAVTVAAR
jgi:alkanesulfonate monooxygenase SsuD/methylene tetrahydromethanopterin reductase-like flavin-dependent oxidoreductase (luciferase family)